MPVSALLGRFVPVLRIEWLCTSGTVKRGVGAFVRRCEGRAFSPANTGSGDGGDAERLGRFAQPLRRVLPSAQPQFQRFGLRQNAQVKGRAERSIFQQDKAVVSPHFTPARSAGRKYREQDIYGILRPYLQNLTWGHVWGGDILFDVRNAESLLLQRV